MSDCKCECKLDQDIIDSLRSVMDDLESETTTLGLTWEKLNKIVEENGK